MDSWYICRILYLVPDSWWGFTAFGQQEIGGNGRSQRTLRQMANIYGRGQQRGDKGVDRG